LVDRPTPGLVLSALLSGSAQPQEARHEAGSAGGCDDRALGVERSCCARPDPSGVPGEHRTPLLVLQLSGPPQRGGLLGGAIDYCDPKQQFVEGIIEIRLTPGTAGRARGFVKGRGSRLALPDTPLTAPVTFQLQGSHGECWSGTYASQITRNDGGAFKAKPD
jgi:hypothetical protein